MMSFNYLDDVHNGIHIKALWGKIFLRSISDVFSILTLYSRSLYVILKDLKTIFLFTVLCISVGERSLPFKLYRLILQPPPIFTSFHTPSYSSSLNPRCSLFISVSEFILNNRWSSVVLLNF